MRGKYFLVLFFLSVIIYSIAIFRVKSIIWGDSLYYYAYTRSIIVDHDLDFSNEAYRQNFGFPNEPEISEITGKVTNKFSPGSSILWMPAFLLGYFISGILGLIGFLNCPDGFGFITQYSVAISAITFSILGLFFVYKIILLFFKKNIAFLTTIFLYLTTQMFYYTSLDPLNSHSASFMLSALFLYLVLFFSRTGLIDGEFKNNKMLSKFFGETRNITWQKMITLGVLGGMIVLVRNQDVVVLLPAFIYLLIRKNDNLKNNGLIELLNKVVLFWGSVFLLVSIQLFITLDLYGQLGSPYVLGGEQFFWFKPDFVRVLFSFGNGLFVFAPILFVAVVGLIFAIRQGLKNKSHLYNFALISIISFLLQLYVIASWGKEIIGGPYGSRMFISVLPHLMLGLAVILDRYKNRLNFRLLTIISLITLLINNLLQTAIMLIRF